MSRQLVSTKTAFVLISLVTMGLLVGSALLNQIVFKAASSTATVYFDQSSVQIRPNATFNINVLADLSAPVEITGIQFELNFDPKIVAVTETEASAFWKKVVSRVENGKLLFVAVPTGEKVLVDKSVTELKVANLKFTGLAEGVTNLAFTPANSILAASDVWNSKEIKNIVESVIDTRITVSGLAPVAKKDNLIADAVTTQEDLVFSSQRIVSTSEILSPNSAVILVRLQQPARILIAFGQTTAFGNQADFSNRTSQAAVRIAGLESGKRYYYQVVAEDDNATNKVLGQIKSFELPALSSSGVVDRAELTVFPSRAANETVVYATFFDKENQVVGGLTPELQTNSEKVSSTKFSEVAGLYQAVVNSFETKKQSINYTLLLNGQKYATASSIFDPSLNDSLDGSKQPLLNLQLNQKLINLILGLIAGLLLLGIGFLKLARAK
ncbi:MAG: cohesin domain-containing protein [Patescibacteria group bacterium]